MKTSLRRALRFAHNAAVRTSRFARPGAPTRRFSCGRKRKDDLSQPPTSAHSPVAMRASRCLHLTHFGGHPILAEAGGRSPGMGRPSRYPEQFRHEAVQMAWPATSRGRRWRRLGVNETTLRKWVANALAGQERAANPLSVSPSEFEELRRLRREVAELRVEKEILGKQRPISPQETIRSAASDSSPIIDTPTASSGSVESSQSRARGSTPSLPDRPPRGSRPTRSRARRSPRSISARTAPTERRGCMPSSPGQVGAAAASGSPG